MDRTIRKPIEQTEETVPEAPKTQVTSTIDSGVEVPFGEYTKEHGHPYSVDYFQLGDNWEVFNDEVGIIEDYIKGKIQSGDLKAKGIVG